MKSLVQVIPVVLAAAFLVAACSGRARLADNSGRQFRTIFDNQRDSVPSRRVADLSAEHAKIIMANQKAAASSGRASQASVGDVGGGGMGQGGLLTPATSTFGEEEEEGGWTNENPIRLRAK